MPIQSKVQQYMQNEINLTALSQKSWEVLGKRPFRWQLEAAEAILCGKDVILDVGTGCGKSLCFILPLLMNEDDMALTVSPLSALMIDQANSSRIPTIAVCQETTSRVGAEQMYKDIANRKFRQVIVSPEIATSTEFLRVVLSQNGFSESIRVLNIDEGHCINIWGGSFRPDYAKLGILRGRFKGHVAMQIASATFPDHVLNDVCSKLRLSTNLKVIRVTNSRPNVALSVRTMQHPEESKADLRFIIPPDTTEAGDIVTTLVYCNKRKDTEECTDRMREWATEEGIDQKCIAFYHALIGEKRKREIEDLLKKGDIRVLFCTEALGMGCDLRNISRVVLWGLPPSFCALVQRAGRAGCDLETEGEAILIVPKSVLKENIPSVVNEAVGISALEAESLDRVISDEEVEETLDLLSEEGIYIPGIISDDENEEPATLTKNKPKRRKQFGQDTNISESRALLAFVQTSSCRRIPWNNFFENAKKLQLLYQETTTYRPKPEQRCCDNCQPSLFPVEKITTSRIEKGLKRGKKKKVPPEEVGYIRNKLNKFREQLMDKIYGELTSLSASTLLDDSIIEAIATCGERLRDYTELRSHVHWANGHDFKSGGPNEQGSALMEELNTIYLALDKYDEEKTRAEQRAEEEKEAEIYRENTLQFNITTQFQVAIKQGTQVRTPATEYGIDLGRFENLTPNSTEFL